MDRDVLKKYGHGYRSMYRKADDPTKMYGHVNRPLAISEGKNKLI